jgi:hypothetical protein
MFLGHFAAGLAARRVYPQASLGAWFIAVLLPDLIWPVLLLAGLEHVRIVPGITAFTPLDFYDYPISHSLVAVVGWGAAFGTLWAFGSRTGRTARGRVPAALAAGVISHWVLDALAHRPDVPVLPNGPYVGLGVWYSVAATLAVELSLFAGAVVLFAMGAPGVARRRSFVAL